MNWIKKIHTSTLLFVSQKKKQQQFLWLISSLSFILFGYHYYTAHTLNCIPLIISVSSFIISFIFPLLAFPFLYIWMFAGSILSEITSTIVLGVIYFLVLTPVKFLKSKESDTGWVQPKKESNFNEQF